MEVELLDEPGPDGGTLHIVVADSGDGLAPAVERPEAVFAEGFTTAEPAGGVARAGGQGLGLALARQLARRRGGDVRVLDPGSPGGPGAVFMATLPRTDRRPARQGKPIRTDSHPSRNARKDTNELKTSGC